MNTKPDKSVALTLEILSHTLGVAKLEPTSSLPSWAMEGEIWSVTRTSEELSIVCLQENIPEGITVESGWRALKVQGPLDFGLTGILAAITKPLAEAEISIFAVSTYDTDYVLVKQEKIQEAATVLQKASFTVIS